MAKLFDFEKDDNKLVETVFDPIKRRNWTKQLKKTRKRVLEGIGIVFLLVLCFIVFAFIDRATGSSLMPLGFVVIIFFIEVIFYIVIDTWVKLLEIFERMESLPNRGGRSFRPCRGRSRAIRPWPPPP